MRLSGYGSIAGDDKRSASDPVDPGSPCRIVHGYEVPASDVQKEGVATFAETAAGEKIRPLIRIQSHRESP